MKRFLASAILLTVLFSNVILVYGNTSMAEKENLKEFVTQYYPSLSAQEKEEKENEILRERYLDYDPYSATTNDDFVDLAYEFMMERETYIVDLINSLESENTSFDNWEFNLDYLIDNYDFITSMDSVNILYVDLYIEEYSAEREYRNNSIIQQPIMSRNLYDYNTAAAYAYQYALVYNTAYPDWTSYGGDCANFISQCLYAGGKPMVGTPGVPGQSTITTNWFSSGTSTNTSYVSSTWRGASSFKTYWTSNASSYSSFSSMNSSAWFYGNKGDAVSLLNSNGAAYHTLMIIGYSGIQPYDFTVAAHTNDYNNRSLSEYTPPGGFIIYNMR